MINTVPMLNMLLMLVLTLAGSYLVLKPAMAGWEVVDEDGRERFAYFKGKWPKLFVGAGAVGAIIASYGWLQTGDTAVGFILGLLTALLGIAAWTDAHVYKVPYELSVLTCMLALGFFLAMLFSGHGYDMLMNLRDQGIITIPFMPRVYFDEFGLYFFISTLVVAGLGFFLAVKTKRNSLLYVGAAMMFFGLFLFLYGILTAVAGQPFVRENEYLATLFTVVLIAYPFIGVAAGYDLFLPTNGIGGADTIIFWTYGFALSFWITSYNLFMALILAFILQLLLHTVAKRLGIGYEKIVRNGPIRQAFVNSKAKRNGVEPMTKHVAYPVPFIPMLAFGVIGSVIVILGFPGIA